MGILDFLKRAARAQAVDYPILCDVSRYQGAIDFNRMKAAGAAGVYVRTTVGDYYTDPNMRANYEGAKAAGLPVGGYLVVAPADTAGRKINGSAHVNYHLEQTFGMAWDLPLVPDCELSRNQSKDYITAVIWDILNGLPSTGPSYNDPIIYTRQSWWDTWVLPIYDWWVFFLWAARYSTSLSGPWSDGYYRFRDWDDWLFWQWSADGNGRGAEFGCSSSDIDLDYFNGTIEQFRATFGLDEPPISELEQKVEQLERDFANLEGNFVAQGIAIMGLMERVAALEGQRPPS